MDRPLILFCIFDIYFASLTFKCRGSTAAILVCYCYFISTKCMGVMMEYMSTPKLYSLKDNFGFANFFKKALWPSFMHKVQLPQDCRATTSRQFTFYHVVPRNCCYSFKWPQKNERLSRPWSQPVANGFYSLTKT